MYLIICHIVLFSVEFTSEPKAIPEWPDRQASNGETEVGYGVQGLPGVCRWLHEYAGEKKYLKPCFNTNIIELQ